ncbi:hypothetical protein ASPFODRAFT_37788 [Aspergillus luchuensis CBS 106.47]|uniref:Aminotransferase class I/classII large domain-containing protein n=1 Tax=Aspergillus luchuensis (strain CBS 106.47) TaxID=1137211 RepID=A0A1M3T288_ASPLC|nr:hypothetical protein ASPFODRAFT_37788 [Aspergillus luchuensis CBS 106.47]
MGCKRPCRQDLLSPQHVESFREALLSALGQPLIQEKERSVFVAVESVYSMEGDICPLKELVEAAKDVLDNAHFFVDEAHGTGVIGPNGSGLVNALGLEKEVAVRLHTFSKALGANGAMVLGKRTIRDAFITLARPVFFSTALSFPFCVAYVSSNVEAHLYPAPGPCPASRQDVLRKDHLNPAYQKAVEMGILSVPLTEGWNERSFVTPIVPIWTQAGYQYWLFSHLALAKICAFPVQHPTVPKKHPRVERVTFVVCEWAQEMIHIKQSKDGAERLPRAAQELYYSMKAGHAKL